MPKISQGSLDRAIWTVGRSFVGGDINDVEWRAIMRLALQLRGKLYGKYYSLSAKELASAACAIYFGR